MTLEEAKIQLTNHAQYRLNTFDCQALNVVLEELEIHEKALEYVCKKIDKPNYKEFAKWCVEKAREE